MDFWIFSVFLITCFKYFDIFTGERFGGGSDEQLALHSHQSQLAKVSLSLCLHLCVFIFVSLSLCLHLRVFIFISLLLSLSQFAKVSLSLSFKNEEEVFYHHPLPQW